MKEFDRVIGYDSIKRELSRIIDVIKNSEKYEALGVSMPQGVLLNGGPGIGKSLLAKCFMEATGRKSFIIRKDQPDGEFVNHIREIFEKAANDAPSVVLLDDMDKFANSDNYHRDTEEYVTIQSCIDDVKGKNVFVIATTNDISKLPDSLVRSGRFDRTFYMQFPTGEDAKKIISFYLQNKKVAGDVDAEEIARFAGGRSCADFESVINEAGISAGFEGKLNITQDNILKAILYKIYGFIEKDEDSQADLRRRAIHEAGHAVATELFYPGTVSFATILSNNRGIGGMVMRNTVSISKYSLDDYEREIMISLAGKAAIDVVLQEIDIGADGDLHEAFDYTRYMIDDFCKYGFDSWCHGEETSQLVFDKLDTVTSAEMAGYYTQVKKILNDNRSFLDAIVEKLIEKKTLSYKDIAVIREAV